MAAAPPVAILAYGSLIARPGHQLAAMIAERRPCQTPFCVEFGRVSRRWGWGPVLTIDPRGAPVRGCLLILRPRVTLGSAVAALAEREGARDPGVIVAVPGLNELTVIAAALPRNIATAALDPAALARRAIASMRHGRRNGVAYLVAAVGSGIATPRTADYLEAVQRGLGAGSLERLERLVALAADHGRGGLDGLG